MAKVWSCLSCISCICCFLYCKQDKSRLWFLRQQIQHVQQIQPRLSRISFSHNTKKELFSRIAINFLDNHIVNNNRFEFQLDSSWRDRTLVCIKYKLRRTFEIEKYKMLFSAIVQCHRYFAIAIYDFSHFARSFSFFVWACKRIRYRNIIIGQ